MAEKMNEEKGCSLSSKSVLESFETKLQVCQYSLKEIDRRMENLIAALEGEESASENCNPLTSNPSPDGKLARIDIAINEIMSSIDMIRSKVDYFETL